MCQQASEVLTYQGVIYHIGERPLEQYLKKNKIEFYPTISVCWRGYVGTWKVGENKLYLTSLSANLIGSVKVGLDFLFQSQTEVFADWFSGFLCLPQGEIIGQVYNSTFTTPVFEESIILTFENGSLVSKKTIKNVVPEYEDLPF